MSVKELNKLLWKERIDKILLCGSAILLMTLVYLAISYLRQPLPEGPTIQEVYGKVISEPTQGVEFYATQYRVQLESGYLIRANGVGLVPNRYRGRVKLQRINNGGGDHYQIISTVP
jgi:hypothetical protein